MAEHIDDLTIAYEEDGIEVIKEIDKAILSKGAWSTIIFRYIQWEKAKDAYSKDRYSIRRYQKRLGSYQLKSKFNISSPDQAQKVIEILSQWLENQEEIITP